MSKHDSDVAPRTLVGCGFEQLGKGEEQTLRSRRPAASSATAIAC